jgi:hypothetical protein
MGLFLFYPYNFLAIGYRRNFPTTRRTLSNYKATVTVLKALNPIINRREDLTPGL